MINFIKSLFGFGFCKDPSKNIFDDPFFIPKVNQKQKSYGDLKITRSGLKSYEKNSKTVLILGNDDLKITVWYLQTVDL